MGQGMSRGCMWGTAVSRRAFSFSFFFVLCGQMSIFPFQNVYSLVAVHMGWQPNALSVNLRFSLIPFQTESYLRNEMGRHLY